MAPRCGVALIGLLSGAAGADCIDDAARHHQVPAQVLRAIGWHESRLRPEAVHRNLNGSVDIGAFQINSVHLPLLRAHGIEADRLRDGCTAAYVGAWHYRRQIERWGDSWEAVGAYHSDTPARRHWYANRIAAVLVGWGVLAPGSQPFRGVPLLAPDQRPPPAVAPIAILDSTPESPR